MASVKERSTLKPSQAAFREQFKASGADLDSMSDAEARTAFDSMTTNPAIAGQLVPVHNVEDRSIPGPSESGVSVPVRIYTAAPVNNRQPAFVFLHGGGWYLGSIAMYDNLCRRLAVGCGLKVISVAYRLAPEAKFPAGLEDCFAALKWVSASSDELGVDSRRIFIGGDSAGGNLSAACTLLARERGGPSLAGQVLIYPVLGDRDDVRNLLPSRRAFGPGETMVDQDGAERIFNKYLTTPQEELTNPLVVPMLATDLSGLPPALVLTAEYDTLLDDGKQYAELLKKAGNSTTYKMFLGMLHGFLSFTALVPEVEELIQDIASWDQRDGEANLKIEDEALVAARTPRDPMHATFELHDDDIDVITSLELDGRKRAASRQKRLWMVGVCFAVGMVSLIIIILAAGGAL